MIGHYILLRLVPPFSPTSLSLKGGNEQRKLAVYMVLNTCSLSVQIETAILDYVNSGSHMFDKNMFQCSVSPEDAQPQEL